MLLLLKQEGRFSRLEPIRLHLTPYLSWKTFHFLNMFYYMLFVLQYFHFQFKFLNLFICLFACKCIWLLDAWYKTWGLGLWGYGVALRLKWPLFGYEVWKLWKGKSTTWHCGGWSPRENWTWVAPPELNGRMQSQRSRGSKESDPSSTERMKESQGLVMRQQQQLDLVGWGRSLGWRHILNMKRAMDQLLALLCLRLPTNTKNL